MEKKIIALPLQSLTANLNQLNVCQIEKADNEIWVSITSGYLMDYMDAIIELKKLNYRVLLILEDSLSESARAELLRLAVWSNIDGILVNENANGTEMSEVAAITNLAIKERRKDLVEARKCNELLQQHAISFERYSQLKGMNIIANNQILLYIQLYQASSMKVRDTINFIKKSGYSGIITDEETAKLLRQLNITMEIIVVNKQATASSSPNNYGGIYYTNLIIPTELKDNYHM